MSKCPYCNNKLHLEDFFHITSRETKKGKIKKKIGDFTGEELKEKFAFTNILMVSRMWVCPLCDKILSITQFGYAR